MWDEGVGDVINRREAWLNRNAATLVFWALGLFWLGGAVMLRV